MLNNIQALAAETGRLLKAKNLMLVTAESCTGGLIAEMMTAVPGSSGCFERGFVTYSNIAKQEMLGVQAITLAQHGAVSEQTAYEMAVGALQNSHAQVSIAVTGIAGPGGGTLEKPVGTVWLAWAIKDGAIKTQYQLLTGDRTAVRQQATRLALLEVIQLIDFAPLD